MSTKIYPVVLLTTLMVCNCLGDVLILRNGQLISGTILQQSAKEVLIQLDYGTLTYPRSSLKEIQPASTAQQATEVTESARIPPWSRIITELAKQEWATSLRQIPATVIDRGVLRHVPYLSFQAASGGYELNIYGDLDQPAGFELGVRSWLLEKESAKSNCVYFVGAVLANEGDRGIVQSLNVEKDRLEKDGLSFEITPSTDPDAYGGWWVSVYSEELLDASRASDEEIKAITQPLPAFSRARVTPPPSIPTERALQSSVTGPTVPNWSAYDLQSARPIRSSSTYSGGGGRVFVRGYTRKNGTYVQPHTRRAPRR